MICQLGSDSDDDSNAASQVQFLIARIGLSASAARVVAPHLWGMAA